MGVLCPGERPRGTEHEGSTVTSEGAGESARTSRARHGYPEVRMNEGGPRAGRTRTQVRASQAQFTPRPMGSRAVPTAGGPYPRAARVMEPQPDPAAPG